MTTLLSQYSAVFGLAVDLYIRHVPNQQGRCNCGRFRCLIKANAASVIQAAGIDPRIFDPQCSSPAWCMTTVPLPIVLPRRERL
jgi:hypothetical protein